MNDPFYDLRHYTEDEARIAIQNLFQKDVFIETLELFRPNVKVDKILKEYPQYHTIYDFQLSVAKDFVEYFIDNTTFGVEMEGLENIDKNKQYLFIANHRDIVFDTSLLQYYFMVNHYPTSKIAIGDNLLSTPLLTEIGKINKMITVKRSVSLREKLENYRLLSGYLHHSILDEHDSVWIAQRNGRTKNGIDRTQHGLVKMFSMTDPKNPVAALKELNIVPVTISYELEVCDQLKARELALSEDHRYEKKPGEDFESIKQGLFGQKGRVHLVIGTSLNDELDNIPAHLNSKDTIDMVCKIIDNQIYKNYKLFPTNYIAYDYLENTEEFTGFYTEEGKREFLRYLDKQSRVEDVSEEKMMNYLLQIYSNPVKVIVKKEIPQTH